MIDLNPYLADLPEPLADGVLAAWSSLRERLPEESLDQLPGEALTSIPRVWAASPFVAEQCVRRPPLLLELLNTGRLLRANHEDEVAAQLREALNGLDDEAELMAGLRRFRNLEMVRIAWRDIAGWASLDETLMDVSMLAQHCVEAALERLFQEACEARATPLNHKGEPQSLVVLGMGKLGAWELNYSSDIDLIFAYRDEGVLDDRRETSHVEFYTRLARKLVKVLDTLTEDGFVFRVDTRLRPFGDSGPLVASFDALESYYQSQAREWERYAMVKVRTIAGDMAAGEELEAFLRPFVYRRYLDYRALGELRSLKRKITDELMRKDRQENIKLGPGGIREIEFIGQAFQLIRGGFEKGLQERRIQPVLERLRDLELMPPEPVETLLTGYRYLRKLENRLQQYEDRQTHELPASPEQQRALALALGHREWGPLKQEIDEVRERVHAIFEEVISGKENGEETEIAFGLEEERNAEILERLGWPAQAIEAIVPRLTRFQMTHAVRHLSARGRQEYKRVMPLLVREVGHTEAPAVTMERILDLIKAIASRNVYLTLLAENPTARVQLVRLAASSPWISHYIAQHPLLLDELLDTRTLYAPLTREALQQQLTHKLAGIDADDPEQFMTLLCHFKQSNVLRVAAADLFGAIPVMVVSDYLTSIAEVLVDAALEWSWRITVRRHGTPQGARGESPDGFGIIAYGKMGGVELGYGSDLDLVFLYDGDPLALTEGPKPVTHAEFYGRIGKRIVHLLTTNSPAGVLYETDLRLRPSGSSGLLVSSTDAYETYQMESAWTWEQQALVKARFVAGDPRVAARFAEIRERSLTRQRDPHALREEVREMRVKMRENLGSRDAHRFQVKQDPGGIVDIEFLVQFAVLAGAESCHPLVEFTDVIGILGSLTLAGLFSLEEATLLKEAYCVYRERTHHTALQERPPLVDADEYSQLRSQVSRIWHERMDS